MTPVVFFREREGCWETRTGPTWKAFSPHFHLKPRWEKEKEWEREGKAKPASERLLEKTDLGVYKGGHKKRHQHIWKTGLHMNSKLEVIVHLKRKTCYDFQEITNTSPSKHVWLLIWHCSLTDGKKRTVRSQTYKQMGRARASWITAKLMDSLKGSLSKCPLIFIIFFLSMQLKLWEILCGNIQHWVIPKRINSQTVQYKLHCST